MLKQFLIYLLIFTCTSAFSKTNCSDNDLVASGWVKHSSDQLTDIIGKLSKNISSPSWKDDLETNFFSGSLEKFVHFQSWDNLETNDLEMFGDVIFYSDIENKQILEVRWYENGQKHFVVSSSLTCSVDEVPLAENALF